jgi:hypothetical protein
VHLASAAGGGVVHANFFVTHTLKYFSMNFNCRCV